MLTKRKTILALKYCFLAFFAFWVVGIILQEYVLGRNVIMFVFVGIGMTVSGILVIVTGLSTIVSYATALFVGSPLEDRATSVFYYLLWRDLQDVIKQRWASRQGRQE